MNVDGIRTAWRRGDDGQWTGYYTVLSKGMPDLEFATVFRHGGRGSPWWSEYFGGRGLITSMDMCADAKAWAEDKLLDTFKSNSIPRLA